MAGRGIFVVVEVVIPHQFFSGGDVAHRKEPDAAFDLVDFTVGIAGVVQVGAQAFAVDHCLAVVESIQVSAGDAIVATVGFFGSDAVAGVFDHAGSLADGSRGVDADGVNG